MWGGNVYRTDNLSQSNINGKSRRKGRTKGKWERVRRSVEERYAVGERAYGAVLLPTHSFKYSTTSTPRCVCLHLHSYQLNHITTRIQWSHLSCHYKWLQYTWLALKALYWKEFKSDTIFLLSVILLWLTTCLQPISTLIYWDKHSLPIFLAKCVLQCYQSYLLW